MSGLWFIFVVANREEDVSLLEMLCLLPGKRFRWMTGFGNAGREDSVFVLKPLDRKRVLC